MRFVPLAIPGAFLLEQDPFSDDRGAFSRQFCRREMEEAGIPAFDICQCNLSTNVKKGTIRGLHYQKEPHPEPKIVTCLFGTVYDAIVDLRRESPTYLRWEAKILDNPFCSLYIPPKVAHGFQTLADDTAVYYQLGEYFFPECYAGVRFNDPKLNINWPINAPIAISVKDASYPLLEEEDDG
jgi:dTDP-4-dehydrorhamnose 3,5-epimerase